MRKIIITLFIIAIGYTIYNNVQLLSEENDIDFLEKSLKVIKDTSLNNQSLYFFSNTKSPALYYKTQFVLAPKIIVKETFSNIPKDSYILAVIDKRVKNKNLIPNKNLKTKDTLINIIDDENYQITLLKK